MRILLNLKSFAILDCVINLNAKHVWISSSLAHFPALPQETFVIERESADPAAPYFVLSNVRRDGLVRK